MTTVVGCAPTEEAIAGFWRAVDAGEPIVLVHPKASDAERARIASAAGELPPGAIAIATSGTTGVPKIVVHTRASLDAAAASSLAAIGAQADDRWTLCLPWSGAGGLMILVRARRAGLPVELAPLGEGAAALRARLVRAGTTLVSVVPAQLAGLVDAGPPPPSLRGVIVGGEGTPPDLVARARAGGWPVRASYGMTETAGMVALARVGDPPGAPLPLLDGVSIRVVDADADGVGRLAVRAPAAAGEIVTDDRGRVDAAGVTVLGRLDDMIIVKGAKIAPREVEDALLASETILEVMVVGIPEGIGALVVPALGKTPRTSDAVAALPAWKRPSRVVVVDTLPRTAAGKRDRVAARALFER